jgi:hypothetical protein
MTPREYMGYFLQSHNNEKCVIIDRSINTNDLTVQPIIDLVKEKKPEVVIYHYPLETATEWITHSWNSNKGNFILDPYLLELDKVLVEYNCKFYLILGCHYPELYNVYNNLFKNFELLYWPTYLITHTYQALKDLYLGHRGLDGPMKVQDLCINKNFDKLYLNYNNKARYHRCLMIDELIHHDLFKDGINSWNMLISESGVFDIIAYEGQQSYDFKYWKEERINVDGYKIKERGFADEYTDMILNPGCFMNLVCETSKELPFVTEKTYRPILIEQPFLCFGAKNQNKELLKYGFELYDEIFDYSFDSLENVEDRVLGIIENLKNIRGKNYYELYDMILPKIKRNKERALFLYEDDTEFNPYVRFYEKYGPDR